MSRLNIEDFAPSKLGGTFEVIRKLEKELIEMAERHGELLLLVNHGWFSIYGKEFYKQRLQEQNSSMEGACQTEG